MLMYKRCTYGILAKKSPTYGHVRCIYTVLANPIPPSFMQTSCRLKVEASRWPLTCVACCWDTTQTTLSGSRWVSQKRMCFLQFIWYITARCPWCAWPLPGSRWVLQKHMWSLHINLLGLAKTIYIRCIVYGIFGRRTTEYAAIYGAYTILAEPIYYSTRRPWCTWPLPLAWCMNTGKCWVNKHKQTYACVYCRPHALSPLLEHPRSFLSGSIPPQIVHTHTHTHTRKYTQTHAHVHKTFPLDPGPVLTAYIAHSSQ